MVFSSFIALTFSMRHIRDGVILLVAFKTIVFVFGHIWASLSHEDRGRDDRVRPRLVRRSLRLYGASWRHHEIRRRISFDLNSVIYPISLKISLWFKLLVCVHSGDRVWSVMDLSCKRSLCSIVLRIIMQAPITFVLKSNCATVYKQKLRCGTNPFTLRLEGQAGSKQDSCCVSLSRVIIRSFCENISAKPVGNIKVLIFILRGKLLNLITNKRGKWHIHYT
jgi:hypothetical protein